MILRDLQSYLEQHQRASLQELAWHFRIQEETLRPMLELLQRKGRVRLLGAKKCGSCTSCSPLDLEVYEAVAKGGR
jgi:predicted ArsR family transcriptional regulator